MPNYVRHFEDKKVWSSRERICLLLVVKNSETPHCCDAYALYEVCFLLLIIIQDVVQTLTCICCHWDNLKH
jgi:hypothetical protein